jgi:FkbM family methyltransferase
MNLAGRLGGRPVGGPFPGWSFGQPRRSGAAYLVRRALWKLVRHKGSRYRVICPWLQDTTLELVLSSDIGRCVWVAGCFEPNEMYLLSKLLGTGCSFVDVGANIGLYTLPAARLVGPSGKVLSFEPSPREGAFLKRNVERNSLSWVSVDDRAVGDLENGRALLHLADEQHGGQNTLGSVVYEKVRLVADADVAMTTLDRAIVEHGLDGVDVLKIDVEGAEFKVLSGARNLLGKSRPVLMMELQEESLLAQGASSRQVLELLRGFDYEVYSYAELGHAHLLRRLHKIAEDSAQDVVAVPVEADEQVVSL